MSGPVLAPPVHHEEPLEVAPGTFLVREVQHALGEPLSVYINSLVLLGEEPVLVDTGSARNRAAWLEDTFSLVDPKDVAWVFVSHEDADHVGNLAEVLSLCPRATLVASWAMVERASCAIAFPLERSRWVVDGDTLEVGDRRLQVLRPPIYDSPTTRGLLDPTTGVYWGVDLFATPVPGGAGASGVAAWAGDVDEAFWRNGVSSFALNALSPWLQLVDPAKFATEIARIRANPITTVVSAHSPALTGSRLDLAWGEIGGLAGAAPPPVPDQAALEIFLAATAPPA